MDFRAFSLPGKVQIQGSLENYGPCPGVPYLEAHGI